MTVPTAPIPQPESKDFQELARIYASIYASPHHITFTTDGLKRFVAAQQAQPEPECGNTPYDEGPFTIAQPERAPKINLGTIGHIGLGKSTLSAALAGVIAHGIKQGGQHD